MCALSFICGMRANVKRAHVHFFPFPPARTRYQYTAVAPSLLMTSSCGKLPKHVVGRKRRPDPSFLKVSELRAYASIAFRHASRAKIHDESRCRFLPETATSSSSEKCESRRGRELQSDSSQRARQAHQNEPRYNLRRWLRTS